MKQHRSSHRRRGGLSSAAIARPVGTVMLASVVLVLGAYFLTGIPLDLLPRITYPQVRASVTYDGVEPEVLEEIVARPLETTLATTENLTRMETEVQEGRVSIDLHFSYGTNVDFALQDAAKNLDRARARLPDEANPPTIFKFDPSQIPIYQVAFSSGDRDLIALREWAEFELVPQMLTIEGVAAVDVAGGLVREIQVIADPERLTSYGLSIPGLLATLAAGNQDVAAGRVTSPELELVGKTAGRFRSVDEIRALPISLPGGGRVLLGELAEIRDTHREQRLWTRLDGVPAVRVSVRKQPDANTVEVADGVDRLLARLDEIGFVPDDIRFRTTHNQSEFIRSSLNAVRNAAVMGGSLAMLTVFFFLGSLRKTFIIGTAIPLAVLATFALMGLGDLTLNVMSMGGLALGVGLLIDNSIVMLENIFRRVRAGDSDPEQAAHRGAAEVASAVTAATSTNLAAVVPFLLISGLAALIFRELILTISFAILASLTVALTVVPMLSAQLAKVRFTSGLGRTRPLVLFDRGVQGLRNVYRRAATVAVRWRWAVLGAAVLALAGSLALVRNVGTEFLPQVDDGNLSVRLTLPPGATPEETNRVALEIEALITEMPDVETVFATAGGFLWGTATSERSGRGSIDVRLRPVRERRLSGVAWVRVLQEKIDELGFPGARIDVRPPRIRGLRTSVSDADVAITVQGQNLAELQRLGLEVMARMEGVPGLTGVTPSADEASPQVVVEPDRERAVLQGLDATLVGQSVRTALDGTVATRFIQGNREYDVLVRLPRERFRTPSELRSVVLYPQLAGRGTIYLSDVAAVRTGVGPTTILRENQNRIFRVTGDVLRDVASIGEVNDTIRERLAGLELPQGYSILYGGEEEAIRESNRQLATVILLAIFLVLVVLAVQYESLVNPFVILMAIPLSLIGVGVVLGLTGTTLSAPVLLGVILLAGIVVNNAILLVQYVEQFRREEGVSAEEAVVEAGVVRLRPILMTTLTTAFGMLPLALGIGQGTELMRPLALAVVGGLSVSAFLTLFVVPSAYLILHRFADTLATWLTGGKERPPTRRRPEAPAPATPALRESVDT